MKAPLQANWSPSDEVLAILEQNNIPREFSAGQVYEFKLYWSERGESHFGWNAKFMKHVVREYRYKQIHDAKQRNCHFMFSEWQPQERAFSILAKEGITYEFAMSHLSAFILYWSDRGDWASNWNTRFIEHVRYKAKSVGTQKSKDVAIAQQLVDRSWAASKSANTGEIGYDEC